MKFLYSLKNILFLISLLLTSCNLEEGYFPYNEGKQVFYDIFFQDKENKKKNYRQSFYFLPKIENSIPVLKNDGEVIFYVFEKEGDLANRIRSASGQIGANAGAGCALCQWAAINCPIS